MAGSREQPRLPGCGAQPDLQALHFRGANDSSGDSGGYWSFVLDSVHHTWNSGGCCNTQYWAGAANRTPDFYWCKNLKHIYSHFCVVVGKSSWDSACSLWNGKRVWHWMFMYIPVLFLFPRRSGSTSFHIHVLLHWSSLSLFKDS